MEGAGAAPEGGEGRTTRPERTSRAGPLPVTFSPFVEFIFPLSGPLASHPRLHGTRREQTTSKFRCLMNGTRLFSPFSPLRFSFFLFFFSSIRLRCFRTFSFLFPFFSSFLFRSLIRRDYLMEYLLRFGDRDWFTSYLGRFKRYLKRFKRFSEI